MKSTVKKIVTAGLGAVLLSVICMLIACTDAPDSSEYEAEKIDGGVSLIVKRDRQVIDIYAVTSDKKPVTVPIKSGIPLRIESGAPTSIPLIQTGTKLILKGNIIELTCTNNDLTALNVQGVPALQKLDCSGNELTSLDVHGLTALKDLDCFGNKLTSLDVQSLKALQKLSCSINSLDSLDVHGLTALEDLGCSANRLTSLDASGLINLKELGCSHNRLTSLNVRGLRA